MKQRRFTHLLLLVSMAAALLLPAPVLAQEQPTAGPGSVYLPTVSTGARPPSAASHTPNPTSVTIAGSLQSELGCPGDWDPACAATQLAFDAADDVWQGVFGLPAGGWEYKAALNNGWDENYGANAQPNGGNIALNLAADTEVKFYYDHKTHWITSNQNARIVTAAGSFQSAIGCPGDWQPDCLRSWLQDHDGDGTYTATFADIPVGGYEVKATIGESWDENYGAGGAAGGDNIPFTVARPGNVTFRFVSATNTLTVEVPSAGGQDNNVEWDGLGHNSHDDLYRVPFGAVTPGTEVTLRFRTFAGDVTGVRVRVWDTTANAQRFLEMEPAAGGVACYDPALEERLCDFWQTSITPAQPTILYYRFIVSDGTDVNHYEDDDQRDGGWGETVDTTSDRGYVITVYDAAFTPLEWMQDAIVYQIFPDRFRNGRSSNDPRSNEPRYGYPPDLLDRILLKPWGALPEGYCRHYENPATPCTEGPRGRDYFGGDLRGVQQRLNYLDALGVTAIYFNPIFEAASNHAYDTQDYYRIDHFFGDNKEFEQLAREAQKRGIRIILDGVFNHVSSDSAYFDRYGRFDTLGACESVDSPYRDWFYFRDLAGGPCAGPNGPNSMTYDAWFGFDSLPVLNKSNQQVQDLVYAGADNVAQFWLKMGADGWRLDVMGDASFPPDFWPEFRAAVKAQDPSAVIIGELWKKFEVLPHALGYTADTSMNYRFRNAILGYFGEVDDKGFVDDGQMEQPPSLFANKLISVREDYPDAVYYTLMNILDSHDTQRILWSLTAPGQPRNREVREFNAENLAAGKAMLRLATIVQMTTPGAPTIYYGDEVGLTGDDDPDDRRTFPWLLPGLWASDAAASDAASGAASDAASIDAIAAALVQEGLLDPSLLNHAEIVAAASAEDAGAEDAGAEDAGAEDAGAADAGTGAEAASAVGPTAAGASDAAGFYSGDLLLLLHYRILTALRASQPVFRDGDLSFLLVDDANATFAYLMRTPSMGAVVAVNRNDTPRTLAIPLEGALPTAVRMLDALRPWNIVRAANGVLTVNLPPRSAAILLPTRGQDLSAPAAPQNLAAVEGSSQVTLTWSAVGGAAQYVIYRSPVRGGGYVEVGRTAGTQHVDSGMENGRTYFYVVRALDAAGNLGPASNEADAQPRYTIGWANLQWPPTLAHTISAVDRTDDVYGQVWIDGITNQPGATPTLIAQAGFGPVGTNPAADPNWVWEDAAFNTDAGNNDEFRASFLPDAVGTFDYLYRYSTTGGAEWLYADLDGPVPAGALPPNPGRMTVAAGSDTTPPAAPTGLRVVAPAPTAIELAWDAVEGDASLYGYEVLRATAAGGPYTQIARVTAAAYTDAGVSEGNTYFYVVRAVDQSFNRSGNSNEVSATAAARTVSVTFNVTVPATTDATGRSVHLAGTLTRLDGGLPDWAPGEPRAVMSRVDATTWTLTLTGREGTQIEYKYALGDWEHGEKGAACEEISNRRLTLEYGAGGTQTVDDTVLNWRNVAPCGN